MRDLEGQFIANDAQIIWMLQESGVLTPATSQDSQNFFSADPQTSGVGIRVGDADTQPVAGAFEDSPFIPDGFGESDRGFAMVVRKSDMRIVWAEFNGNERNISGQDVLDIAITENAP